MFRREHAEEEKGYFFHNESVDLLFLFINVKFRCCPLKKRHLKHHNCTIRNKFYLNRYLTKLSF